ncbi:hypothetical protein, partial [Falsiroseomonas oryzae]|uniref:hypothetical protein n=1 Tax=Falsiroseomonas oryzae TaxID=2766473 RepID=UPI0022EB9A5D
APHRERLPDFLRRWLRWQVAALGARPARARWAARILPDLPPPWLPAMRAWHDINANLRGEALRRWVERDPGRTPAPTTLFRSDQPRPGVPDDLGWGQRSDLRRVVPVQGNHHTMLEPPHRPALCATLTHALLEAAGALAPGTPHQKPEAPGPAAVQRAGGVPAAAS